jgi:hypothetical protein
MTSEDQKESGLHVKITRVDLGNRLISFFADRKTKSGIMFNCEFGHFYDELHGDAIETIDSLISGLEKLKKNMRDVSKRA